MVPDKFERYAVSDGPEGLHIEMRQASHCVGFGVFTLVMLAAGWAISTPLDPGWWAWMGLWMVCGALVAMSALWTEDWQVCSSEVRYQNSFRLKESCIQRFPGKPLALRVEALARASDFDTEKLFPHVVHLIGPDGDEVGYGFAFRRESNLDRFVETLGRVLPLEVDDHRRQKMGVYGRRNRLRRCGIAGSFDANGAIYQVIDKACCAVHDLQMKLHYESCGRGVGRPSDEQAAPQACHGSSSRSTEPSGCLIAIPKRRDV